MVFARFRPKKKQALREKAVDEEEEEDYTREGLGRWLLRWAPGLSLKHVNFAEETMAKHNFNPDRLRPPDVMQLMYMFGFNPTATAMDEVYEKIGTVKRTPELEAEPEPIADQGLGTLNVFKTSSSLSATKKKAKETEEDERYVDLRGFLRIWAEYRSISEKEELLLVQAFRFFDRDGNGSISVAEFESVMTELGDDRLTLDECSLFIKLIDKDGDQEVQIDEFLNALKGEQDAMPASAEADAEAEAAAAAFKQKQEIQDRARRTSRTSFEKLAKLPSFMRRAAAPAGASTKALPSEKKAELGATQAPAESTAPPAVETGPSGDATVTAARGRRRSSINLPPLGPASRTGAEGPTTSEASGVIGDAASASAEAFSAEQRTDAVKARGLSSVESSTEVGAEAAGEIEDEELQKARRIVTTDEKRDEI